MARGVEDGQNINLPGILDEVDRIRKSMQQCFSNSFVDIGMNGDGFKNSPDFRDEFHS